MTEEAEKVQADAAALGIAPGYHDIAGTWHAAPAEMLARLIDAMGTDAAAYRDDPPATERCYLPPALAEGGRAWGLALQLYGVTSRGNWGIGDFGDLRALVALCADAGAAALQLNPLHALFPCYPDHVSPYAPSSRIFLNPLYIDIEAVAEFQASADVKSFVASPDFRRRLEQLREQPLVDYEGVAACKFSILRRLFDDFRQRHLGDGGSARCRDFQTFRAEMGAPLAGYALFEELCRGLVAAHPGGWPTWPEGFRDPGGPELRQFADDHHDDILFWAYVQWLAFRQLRTVAADARRRGMAIGLVADIAIGCDATGFEAWWDQDLVALYAEIGAPPDPFCTEGQTWGAPPWRPHVLHRRGGAPLRDLLDPTMTWAGGLRLDHIMGITRQFWVPRGFAGDNGAYVAYPQEALLNVIGEASNLHNCMIIGEDLGTVPEGFRERIHDAGILSTRVLQFEREADGTFRPPGAYPFLSCACAGTHDLPTILGFHRGSDIAARQGLSGTEKSDAEARAERDAAIAALREALARDAPDPEDAARGPGALINSVHAFLGRCTSALVFAQLEDVLGLADQVNLPGTVAGHPNWRRKYPVRLEDLREDGRLFETARVFRRAYR